MKYMMALLTTVLIPSIGHSAEKSAELQSGSMSYIRIHSSNHSVVNARGMALAKIVGLEDGCSSGIFFSASEDKETLSFILAAHASKAPVRLGYDSSIKSPWGDPSYCVLTYFDIK
jgi:hypothetical protein